ncbi:MAG: hypothetical protein CEO22_389 [Candidatus Berkelbacteria bacterium Gr01-1014_85]|uniref:Uncharacterized protein n=1 Tax=Candidatus Berkelbacteria bacterium Gr01-1014_85 TaxID=2017150 RepID=A0A554JBC7_9BACT|nr:MAG: hypothetical protein CEO22_389 [Candidatus Berkelbacteria bacterium Gr01-1014_85]
MKDLIATLSGFAGHLKVELDRINRQSGQRSHVQTVSVQDPIGVYIVHTDSWGSFRQSVGQAGTNKFCRIYVYDAQSDKRIGYSAQYDYRDPDDYGRDRWEFYFTQVSIVDVTETTVTVDAVGRGPRTTRVKIPIER